jgi:DUF1009 family protein
MNIQLCQINDKTIEGFTKVIYSEAEKLTNLEPILDNSCEYILANNVLDDFEIGYYQEIINSLIKKLRLNGALVLSGVDINIFSKNITQNLISLEDASNLIRNKKSMNSLSNIINFIESKGIKVVSAKFIGANYEIFCKREIQ